MAVKLLVSVEAGLIVHACILVTKVSLNLEEKWFAKPNGLV